MYETSDFALPLWAMAYAMNWVTGCPPCDDDCEKNSKMIRNHATYNVIIKKWILVPKFARIR